MAEQTDIKQAKRDVLWRTLRAALFGLVVALGLWFDDMPIFLCCIVGAIVMALSMIVEALGSLLDLAKLTRELHDEKLDGHVRNYHYRDPP